ncbi:MAG: hypothetical protein AAGF20_00770 [Pseudomonadota bacterium]
MTEPSYSHAIRLATDRAFTWSETLDTLDDDDALWEWQFREHINAQRKRYGLEPIYNPRPDLKS